MVLKDMTYRVICNQMFAPFLCIHKQVSNTCRSAGKESTCNAGDPGLIPGLGRSLGEGIGYPHQYSWASLVAQLVKNLPAMWKTWVQSLGWKDPLEKGKIIHSSSDLENSMDCIAHGVTNSRTQLSNFHYVTIVCFNTSVS